MEANQQQEGIESLIRGKGIRLTPCCDVSIHCQVGGLSLHFSRFPEVDLVASIQSLENNPGVRVCEQTCNPTPPTFEEFRTEPLTSSVGYWVGLPQVYDSDEAAVAIAQYLYEEYGLNCRVVSFVIQPEPSDGDDQLILVK